MTIGRTFLLWLLGVLIVTLVLVSALVLWNEQRALEAELENQSRLLAKTLALTVAEGGSPEYLRVISTGDLRAGEARARDGQVLWRYGPPLGEALSLDLSLLRVDESVEVGRGPWTGGDTVDVVLLVSRSRIDRQFAGSAVRLVTALGLTLALALVVFIGVTVIGIAKNGVKFLHLFSPSGVPLFVLPLLIPIEIISYFVRPVSLSVRLFLNMMVGHTMLKVFAGFVVLLGIWGVFPLLFIALFIGFEIFVALLQAYIFAVLSCL